MKIFLKKLAFLMFLGIVIFTAKGVNIKYVTQKGAGLKNGSSWANALDSTGVQAAIDTLATSGGGQVWVAEGTYYPTEDETGNKTPADPRTKTFTLKKGVAVYGSFAGTETTLPATGNTSTLSGNQGELTTNADNSYNVVYAVDVDSTASLNGFTITLGNASGGDAERKSSGGGAYMNSGQLVDCSILNNRASAKGGGAYITGTASIYSTGSQRSIANNEATGFVALGGGVCIEGCGSVRNMKVENNIVKIGNGAGVWMSGKSTTVDGCAIVGNIGDTNGGGVWCSNGRVSNCLIERCEATVSSAIHMENAVLENCVIRDNFKSQQGSVGTVSCSGTSLIVGCLVHNNQGDGISSGGSGPRIINTTSVNNKGKQVSVSSLTPGNSELSNSVFGSINSNVGTSFDLSVKCCFTADGSMNSTKVDDFSSLFKKVTSFNGHSTSADQRADILASDWSPAAPRGDTLGLINAGTKDTSGFRLPSRDLAGNSRVMSGQIDVGAYEYMATRYVTPAGGSPFDGKSWATAYPADKLQEALRSGLGEVWIAAGTYTPKYLDDGTVPVSTTFKNARFAISSRVYVYGGFKGTETSISQRERSDLNGDGKIDGWEFTNQTILSVGEMSGTYTNYVVVFPSVDIQTKTNRTANDSSLLDGVTITGSRADFGIRLEAIIPDQISHCVITGNSKAAYIVSNNKVFDCLIDKNIGSYALYATGGLVSRCVISNNSANNGGGIFTSNTLIEKCIVNNNYSGSDGGGVYIQENSHIKECIITGNRAYSYGGGIYSSNSCSVSGCTITDNRASSGGGLFLMRYGDVSNCYVANNYGVGIYVNVSSTIINTVVVNNFDRTLNRTTGGVYCTQGTSFIYNSTIANNTGYNLNATTTSKANSIVNCFIGGQTFINSTSSVANCVFTDTLCGVSSLKIASVADAGFVRPTTFEGDSTTLEQKYEIDSADWSISPESPLVNAGAMIDGLSGIQTDKAGNPRVQFGGIDIGAYELSTIPTIKEQPMVTSSQAKVATIDIAWTSVPMASGYVVFMKQASVGIASPVDGTSYAADTVFGKSMANVGDGWFAVYCGPGLGVSVSGISPGSWYMVQVVPFRCLPHKTYGITKGGVNSIAVFTKQSQTITFNPAAVITGSLDYQLIAYSSSSLPITFTVANAASGATVKDNRLSSPSLPDTVIVTAHQEGDGIRYYPAETVTDTIIFTKASQSISFKSIAQKIYGDADFAISATATSSLPASFASSDETVASVLNNVVRIKGAGTCVITAIQQGNELYDSAASVPQILVVNKKSQSIVMDSIYTILFGIEDFAPSVKAESNGTVTLTSGNESVATIENGKIHIVGIGNTTITATQAGTGNYLPASTTRVVEVVKNSQTITFATPGVKYFSDSSFVLDGASSSGLAIEYTSSNPAIARINGDTVTILSAGKVTITARQAGNDYFNPANMVTRALTILPADQFIAFDELDTLTYGGTTAVAPVVSASSQLPVTLTSYNLSVAKIVDNKIVIVGAGSSIILATQAGNTNYSQAASIKQVLVVKRATQGINLTPISDLVHGANGVAVDAKASSNLPVTISSADPSVISVQNNLLYAINQGTTTITITQIGNDNYEPVSISQGVTVTVAPQGITFSPIPGKTYGDPSFALAAVATSGSTVGFVSSNSNIISTAGNIATINGAGTVTIKAFQGGNSNYDAADTVEQTITIARKVQGISMDSIETAFYGSTDIAPGVNTSSNGPVTYTSSDESVATILDGKIHIVGIGKTVVTATQAGTDNYLPAYTRRVVEVGKNSQTISFTTTTVKSFSDSVFVLDASSTSGLIIVYTSSDNSVVKISNDTARILSAGKVVITAKQDGNNFYDAAQDVARQFSIQKANQTITFGAISPVAYGMVDTIIPVLASDSKLPVSLSSSNNAVAKIVGGKIVVVGAGEAYITANQDGNSNFSQAIPVEQPVVVVAQQQTVTFNPVDSLVFGQKDTTLNATASSGLPVTVTSSNNAVVRVIGNRLHVVGAGEAQISISQPGNRGIATVDTAITVVVTKAKQSISFAAISDKTYGDNVFSPVVSATSGLDVLLESNNPGVALVVNGTVYITGTGTVTITATQDGNDNNEAATPVTRTFEVKKASQTISFGPLRTMVYGEAPLILDAISSSGLDVTYTSSNPAVARVEGNRLSLHAVGSVIITASQVGDTNTLAAASKNQALTIVKREQSISFAGFAPMEYRKDLEIIPLTSSSEGLRITFTSSDQSVATIVGGLIHVTGAGSTLITAQQEGNDTIFAATPVQHELVISAITQNLDKNSNIPAALTYSLVDTALDLVTTQGLKVSLVSETPNIIQIVNNSIRTVGTGIATLRLVQAGTSGIEAFDSTITITVSKASQTISFPQIPVKKMGMNAFKLQATASSGLTVEYTSGDKSVAELVENEVTLVAPGSATITAFVPETDTYLAASATRTLVVTALNTLKMPTYTISRDTVIDLDNLVLNDADFTYSFISGKSTKAVVNGSRATIVINSTNKAWIGTDTLWFSAKNNTNTADVQVLGVKIRRVPLAEQIGLVTVDSTTGTKCIIAWERSVNAGIKGYVLYRGGNASGVWDSIAYVPATSRSMFVDEKVNTNKQVYQYSMITVDSNDLRSARSATHTTMHLMTGLNLQNKPQLWWTPYVGADVVSYIIYRKNQATGTLDSIGSSILTSFTDVDAPAGIVDYRVAIRFANEINPDRLKSDNGPYSQSLSNMAESELLTTSTPIGSNKTCVYPNPATTSATLALPASGRSVILIVDELGRNMMPGIASEGEMKVVLPVGQLANGRYTVIVITNGEVKNLSLVKE